MSSGLDAVLQLARATVAGVAGGEPFAVYRHSASEPATGVLSGAPVIASILGKVERATTRGWLENEAFEVTTYEAKMPNTNLVVGDLLVRASDGAVFTYAQQLSTRPTIFVRNEFRAIARRPNDQITANGQNAVAPAGQWTLDDGTIDESVNTSNVLTQTDGAYTFTPTVGATPTPVIIPMALQPTSRARPARSTLPTAVPVERFVGYVPPLPGDGFFFRDNDFFEMQDGTGFSYVIEQVFASPIGLVGSILLLSKQGIYS